VLAGCLRYGSDAGCHGFTAQRGRGVPECGRPEDIRHAYPPSAQKRGTDTAKCKVTVKG